MDLFYFIHHDNPTKVRVGEMQKTGDQVSLLEATRGCVVPLAPSVVVIAVSSEENMIKSIDRLFDEGNGAEKEHPIGGGEYAALTKAIVEPVKEDVLEKPRREDYGTSGASASTGGKSHAAAVMFVISLDSSHHFGTYDVDVEVSSLVRSTILDPPVMTAAVTTAVVETSLVLVSKVTVKPVNVNFLVIPCLLAGMMLHVLLARSIKNFLRTPFMQFKI
nr:hypothetical protein [Tanacetum cinerariifolium]